jgi:hypothetical protein
MIEHEHISAIGQGLLPTCRSKKSSFRITTLPRDYWYNFGIGRSGFALSVSAGFRDRRLAVELYIHHRAAKRAFDLLEADRTNIEAEFGEPLDWQRMNDKKASRIGSNRTDLDPRDESQRPMQYEWLLDHMRRFVQVFSNRIRALPLEERIEGSIAASSAEAADG